MNYGWRSSIIVPKKNVEWQMTNDKRLIFFFTLTIDYDFEPRIPPPFFNPSNP